MLTQQENQLVAELESCGFTLNPIARNPSLSSHQFDRSTMTGRVAMLRDASAVYLVEITNSAPHNGEFAAAMDAFERVMRKFKTPFYVLHVWDERFGRHLMTRRRYVPVRKGELYHYVYRATRPDN